MNTKVNKEGLLLGILTYSIWGFFPLFFKLFSGLAVDEILIHRIVWSVVFCLVLVLLLRRGRVVRQAVCDPRTLLKLLLASVLLALNWLVFIYATVTNDVLQMSLGYFINPIFNVIFGVLLFKEYPNAYGKVAIALALLGLSVQFFQVSQFPMLAVTVAVLFSSYGAVRKSIAIDAISGMFIETTILLIPALIYLFFFTHLETVSMMTGSLYWLLLLLLIGPVTSIPLMTFSATVQRIPYFMVGFCQYITPTMMFLWAIFLYGEAWTFIDLITFAFVWCAIVCVVVGVLRGRV